MKLSELHESRMAELDALFQQAEEMAFDEAQNQRHSVSGDRVLAIAKQLIHNEVRDQAMASALIDAISDRVHQEYGPK